MLLTIDFETYFDNECTLKKLNYIQYLNHPRFEVLGAAILTDKTHEFLPHNDLQDFLSTLDPETTSVLAHNTLFDGMILSWIYNFAPAPPARWLDTLSMSKGLLALNSYSLESVGQHFNLPHKKSATFKGKTWTQLTSTEQIELADYAKHDAWLCHEIYKRLQPYPKNELDLIDLTIRMFTEPKLQLDIPLAERLLKEQQDHKTNLLKETQLTKTQLASNQQFAKLLEEKYNIEIPKKISLTTNKETYALAKNDPEFQELQLKAPDNVKKLIEARLAIKSTIEETRINTLIETQNLVGAIPVPLTYYGGHTGRWSGFTYNLQNLPKTSQIRNTLIAPPGHTLIIVDSSSIEARVLAWFAEQQDLVEEFHQKKDPYKRMASIIYNIPVEQITKKSKEREVGKNTILGAGFSMGATKFQATLQKTGINIPFEEAQRVIEIYRKTNNKIVQLWRYLDSQLHTIANGPTKASSFGPSLTSQTTYKCIEFQKNRILLPNGLYLKYPDLQQHDEWTYGNNKKIYGGALTENIIQALARIIIGEQALQAQKEVGPVVLLVHDEIVCCVATNQAEQALNKLLHIMQTSPTWAPDLPLDAEGEISAYYKK